MNRVAHMLSKNISGTVKTGELMSRHTSFKIGGPADLFVEPLNTAELVTVLTCLREEGIPQFLLGNGTNLLVSDSGYRGAVVRLAGEFREFSFDSLMVNAGAAVKLAVLAKHACERGLGGLDFAAGIPGTVGGALVMNAGAHGSSFDKHLVDAVILTQNLEVHTLVPQQLGLSYRKSNLPFDSVVCCVRLKLESGDREELAISCRERLRFRGERQPRQPNAGSIFKNPPQDVAGRLIEAAGLKGRRVGGAMVSDKHANFIVNCGGAMASDVLALIEIVQNDVAKKFNVELELEIRLLGY